jgi:GT2 family glycosyltransferase
LAPVSVTVVVVAWNGASLLDPCLTALAASEDVEFETWVIDNASTDRSANVANSHPLQPRVVRLSDNLGFAGAAAYAVAEVSTPFLVLLNQDTVASPRWLYSLLSGFLTADDVAAVTSHVVLMDGRVNNTGVLVGHDGYGRDRGFGSSGVGVAGPVFGFSGTAVALRVLPCRDAGSFDASFFMYYEDTDLSWRLALLGWRVTYAPLAVVQHHHGASSSIGSSSFAFWNERNRLLMLGKDAPLLLFVREFFRFAAITFLLPLRRVRGVAIPAGHQFRTTLRLRVLVSVVSRLPGLVAARRSVTRMVRRAGTSRAKVARTLDP